MKPMSQQQKEVLLSIYRTFIGGMIGICTFFIVNMYSKIDRMYELSIKHEQEIKQQGAEIDRLRNDINTIRYARTNR